MVKKKKTGFSRFSKLCSKILVLTIIVLVCMIILKGNTELRNKIYKKVFQNNMSFAKINEIYKKYFGSSVPLTKESKEDTQLVSNIKLEYKKQEPYKDGVKLTVNDNYLVPAMDSGLVIFNGKKEEYGNTIIIQRPDNVEVWYANLKNINVSLYDYLKKGDNIGEANGNFIYLVFIKEGKSEDYQKYL